MSLPDDIRSLSEEVLGRIESNREFYVHTRQTWRLVLQLARKGRQVGIVDLATKRPLPADDLGSRAYRYVTVQLAESIFRDLSRLLEDWIRGLIRLWLTAYPEDLDLEFDKADGLTRKKKQDEIHIPLSRVLALPDRDAILGVEIERVVRNLTYERPDKWFRYIEPRLKLGCPDASQVGRLCEMKAARDCIEHNRGMINRDYIDKAGNATRYTEGVRVEIDEPYLLECFTLLRDVTVAMTDAAAKAASGPKPSRPSRRNRGRKKHPAP